MTGTTVQALFHPVLTEVVQQRHCLYGFCQLVMSPASQWHNERVIDTRMSHPTA
jgi:hypothetical protein